MGFRPQLYSTQKNFKRKNYFGLNIFRFSSDKYFQLTRPLSDPETETMYKLKDHSSNMQTGQSLENKELVRPAGAYS